jgi:hypothetical protein
MVDSVELIPVTDQEVEEAVFRAWEEGKGPHALSREFAIPIRRIEEIINNMLPTVDAKNQLFAYKRELRRLEDLSGECFVIAKRDKNPEYMHLFARLNERVCAVRGIGNIRTDPMAVEVAQRPSQHDRIKQVINDFWDRLSPAEKAVRNRLNEMPAERALELLGEPEQVNPDRIGEP